MCNRKLLLASAVTILLSATSSGYAEEVNHVENAKKAGPAVMEGMREIGRDVKKAGKALADGAKGSVETAKETGREAKKAVKGEK